MLILILSSIHLLMWTVGKGRTHSGQSLHLRNEKRGDSVTGFKVAFRMWTFSAEAQYTEQANAEALCPGSRKDRRTQVQLSLRSVAPPS